MIRPDRRGVGRPQVLAPVVGGAMPGGQIGQAVGQLGQVGLRVVRDLEVTRVIDRVVEWLPDVVERQVRPIVIRRAPTPLLRVTDLVALGVTTTGLEVVRPDAGGGPDIGDGQPTAVLRRSGRGAATITLTLPTQAFGEEAYFEASAVPTKQPPLHETPSDPRSPRRTVKRRQAGASRIVFRLRDSVSDVPYTVEGILAACRDADLVVPDTATPPPPAAVTIDPLPWWLDSGRGISKEALLTTSSRIARWSDVAAGAVVFPPTPVVGPARRKAVVVETAEAGTLVSTLGPAVKAPKWFDRITLKRRPYRPTEGETAIEAPYRLFVAPHALSAFVHAVRPVTLDGRTELWHSRLAVRPDPAKPAVDDPHPLRTVRAVWARTSDGDIDLDGEYTHAADPFLMPLDDKDRRDLVVQTADPLFEDVRPVDTARLHVSALGADLDVRGQWTPGDRGTGIEAWAHRATLGRDNCVRVVYAGHLYPTGHRASLVKVTERRFHDRERDASTSRHEATAYLRQRMFIVIKEPERDYAPSAWRPPRSAQEGRAWPFQRATVRTVVTPDLDAPSLTEVGAGRGQSVFCPRVAGRDFGFALSFTDVEGNRLDVTMPMYFVSVENAYDRTQSVLDEVEEQYATTGRNRVPTGGQRLALARSAVPGDTEVAADAISITTTRFKAGTHQVGWYPRLATTEAVLHSAAVLTGKRQPMALKISDHYIGNDFPATGLSSHPNLGEVFAEVADAAPPLPMAFSSGGSSSAATGGFLSPDLAVRALSRRTGPVGGSPMSVTKLAAGQFDPGEFLSSAIAGVLPTLFGCISLADLLTAAGVPIGKAGDALADAVPSFVTEALTAVDSLARDLGQLQREAKAAIDVAKATSAAAGAALEASLADAQSTVTGLAAIVEDLIAAPTTTDPAAAADAALADLESQLTAATSTLTSVVAQVGSIPPDVLPQQAVKVVVGLLVQVRDVTGRGADLVSLLRQTLLLAEEMRVTYSWSTELTSWTVFQASRAGRTAHLDVRATVQAKTKAHPEPSVDVVCGLRDFTLVLVEPVARVMSLEFAALEFRARAGAKPDVNVEFTGIRFLGPLSFVEALRDLIPLDGFSDPPALEISERGIAASYSMSLPDLTFGVFSLQNLSLGAGFTVPFLGDPLSVRFNFCERESPFLLTVSAFGGGGFFGVTLTPAGLKTLEASFEFGASLAMDFGVASGGVSVMGGIYFSIDETNGALLVGYLRILGEVEVLGIVSVSIELNLQLAYQPASGKAVGRATLTLSISVAFFETSVSIECERKFAGSSGDPILAQLVGPAGAGDDPQPWLDYCTAFAPVA